MADVQQFKLQKEAILKKDISDKMKVVELSTLLNHMVAKHNIPLEYGNEYRMKNKDIVIEFESIADEIGKLNSI
ncbi:hypothetical protein [Paenibacillus medicaginis]|uniref:Uncharacterized protein n=1 Tax=Paenibacillus medicaginis TaxID=1470560 RepID=A0ABV5BUQ3_9BACL